MKRKPTLLVLMALAVACFTVLGACTSQAPSVSETKSEKDDSMSQAPYKTITPQEAKTMMESGSPYVLLDVRNQDEFKEGHIEGAVLIPYDQLPSKAQAELPNKDETILLYCRSGRRSAIAAQELASQGYTKVYDFGGILDWPYDVAQ